MATTNPMSQLTRPGATPEFQRRQQRTTDMAMAQLASQAPATGPAPAAPALAQAGAQQAAATGKDAIAAAAQEVANFKGQATNAAAGQAVANQEQQGARQLQTQEQGLALDRQLDTLGAAAKAELFDNRMNFEAQQVGQGALQESQLLDWAATKVQSQEQFKDFAQKAEQTSAKSLSFLKQGYERLEAVLKAEASGEIQRMTNEKRLQIEQAAGEFKRKYQSEQAKKAGTAAMIGGIGTAAGTIVGAVYGGPGGAVAGGAIGGGVGNVVGSQVAQ